MRDTLEVVTINNSDVLDDNMQLLEKLTKPGSLSNGIGDGAVLYHTIGTGHIYYQFKDQEIKLSPRNTP